jgi:hypothetical protein
MKYAKSMIVAAALAASGMATAAVVDFRYGGNVMATMTTSGSTMFTLDFLTAPDSSAFINELFLVGPGGTFSHSNTTTTIAATYSATGFVNAGNTFNWKLDFPQPNNADRFTIGESATWSIVTTDVNAWDFSMLHINAFLNGNSIKIDGCTRGTTGCGGQQVPEPISLALLGAGLLGLGAVRRWGTKS